MAQHAWCYPIEPALRLIVDLLRVGRRARAAVEHDLDLRLPHPRSRVDGGAGARVHARRRLHVRRARHRARARRRRLRAAALVLLGHPQRLLRGDREAARRAPHLGAPHAERYGAKDPRSWMHALPLADGRRDAHRAAADEQHRARRLPGAGRGARRHAVAAHELDGRDARAADRGSGAGRAAHAAGARLRDRRAERASIRSAARTTSRRSPTSSSARPRRSSSEIDEIGGVVRGLETGWFQRKIAESAARQQWEIEQHRRVIVGVNEFVTDEPELDDPAAQDRRGGRARAARAAGEAARDARQRARATQRSTALRDGRATDAEPDPVHPRLRARVLHAVRDPRARWRTCSARTASRCSSEPRAARRDASGGQSYFDAHICSSTSRSSRSSAIGARSRG